MFHIPFYKRMLILLLVTACLLIPLYAQDPNAAPAASPEEGVIDPNAPLSLSLNFQDASLQAVLEYLSDQAGLVIIADEPLDGSMTVISRQPICLDEAISLINSVLMEKGLAAVRMDRILRVVTLDKAKTMYIPVTAGNDPNTISAGDDMVTHIIPVRYADVTKLKENLASLLPEYATLEANEDGNALIVTDTTANIKRLIQIIQALDTHMSLVAEIKVFRLTSADATTTADLINKVFAEDTSASSSGDRGRGGGGPPRGPFEMMMRMRGRGGGGGGGDNNRNQGASTSKATGRVTAVGDERTNSVVVRGPDEALALAEEVINALDTSSTDVLDVKVVQLKYADADNVAELVNEVFGKDRDTSQNDQARGPMFFRGPSRGGDNDDQGSSINEVVAASDDRTNSVVITGPTDMLEVIGTVIKELDSPNADIADVKVFHLEYADAENAAELINEVFGEERNTSSSSRDRNQNLSFRGGPFGGMRGGGGRNTESSSSAVSVVASADDRTNSIVVSGPTDTLEVISGIIEELDANPEQERQLFIYKLKNAEAANLMQVLNNLFAQLQDLNNQGTNNNQRFQGQQAPRGGGTTTTSSTSTDLDEEVYFEADETTNSLVILTSSKNYEKIKPIIEELDEPLQQVLIKVLFAEVTHDDTIDLGTEFSVFNINAYGSRLDQNFGVAAETDGIKFNFLDRDLDVTLRALQETGKLNVLSRPYILTSDNQPAIINVGEDVPFPDSSTITDGGTLSTNVTYQNIGITLEVTPSINPDGLVIMDVKPSITETTGTTVQITETFSAPVYANRSSEAKVAVKDGQTIVIGGLIEDSIKKTQRKVPLLGDIPLLGALFRRNIDTTAKTELLIFVTPTVAENEEELAAISADIENIHTINLEKVQTDPAYHRYIKNLPETAPGK